MCVCGGWLRQIFTKCVNEKSVAECCVFFVSPIPKTWRRLGDIFSFAADRWRKQISLEQIAINSSRLECKFLVCSCDHILATFDLDVEHYLSHIFILLVWLTTLIENVYLSSERKSDYGIIKSHFDSNFTASPGVRAWRHYHSTSKFMRCNDKLARLTSSSWILVVRWYVSESRRRIWDAQSDQAILTVIAATARITAKGYEKKFNLQPRT